LVGSTAIAARPDPEEWRETVARYHRAAAEAITRFDGHVGKYLGDGVMAYFGWPAAHDNDAERAARAGTYFTACLAEAQMCAGSTADARETIEQALGANSDELACRPEILRLRGELRLKLGEPEESETDFRDAITLAQSMSAKSWELRAMMSLARLLRHTRRREKARTMLAEIYNWFTEGFDTADLKDAKALLDELGN
jgi:hypothetical protein